MFTAPINFLKPAKKKPSDYLKEVIPDNKKRASFRSQHMVDFNLDPNADQDINRTTQPIRMVMGP